MPLNYMGELFSQANQINLAMLYFQKSREAEDRARIIRQAILNHERLSGDSLREKVIGNGGNK